MWLLYVQYPTLPGILWTLWWPAHQWTLRHLGMMLEIRSEAINTTFFVLNTWYGSWDTAIAMFYYPLWADLWPVGSSPTANWISTVYPKKYARGFCFAVLCCGYTLTGFPISIRLISLALWQSNDFPSASKATLMNMDKYFMWIHYERLHNHNNKAKHNKTLCTFLGIYCKYDATYLGAAI